MLDIGLLSGGGVNPMLRKLTYLRRRLMALSAIWFWTISGASISFAQQVPAPPTLQKSVSVRDVVPPSQQLLEFFGRKTPYEFWLTAAILVCGLVFLGMSTRFMRTIDNTKLDHATRMVTTILVVVGTLVLITAGYNNEQIAPAFGLFGTLIGYLLGRSQRSPTEENAVPALTGQRPQEAESKNETAGS